MKKPPYIIYGLEDNPPLAYKFLLSFQHVAVIFSSSVIILLFARVINASQEETMRLISLSLFFNGWAVILQSLRKNHIGTGYFIMSGPTWAFAAPSIIAAQIGGLPLVFGMTLLAGLFQMLISKFIKFFKWLFTTELAGLTIFMIAYSLVPFSLKFLSGFNEQTNTISKDSLILGFITLFITVTISVSSSKKLRLFSILIGLIFGYIISIVMGILTNNELAQLNEFPIFNIIDYTKIRLSFDYTMIIPFFIAVLSNSLKVVGDVTTAQKYNDDNWKRADMNSLGKGLFTESITLTLAGFFGTLGSSTSSSNLNLSAITGATSRKLAIFCGIFFFLLSFSPKFSYLFILAPKPVIGAILIIFVCFMAYTGISIITMRMLDIRKILIIGLSFVVGVSVDVLPVLYEGIHPNLKYIFSSSMIASILTAFILNILFRIGVKLKKSIRINPKNWDNDLIYDFIEKAGAEWGARKEIIYKVNFTLQEIIQILISHTGVRDNITISVIYNEYEINAEIIYNGVPLVLNDTKPTEDEFLNDDNGVMKMSIFIIKKYADSITAKKRGDDSVISIHFEH